MKRLSIWLAFTCFVSLAALQPACDSNSDPENPDINGTPDSADSVVDPDLVPGDVTDSITADVVATDVPVDLASDVALDTAGELIGQDVEQDTTDPLCPAEVPIGGLECTQNGMQCDYGQECCCGQCYASTECTCQNGTFACLATDACMIPSCLEPGCCNVDQDCDLGGDMAFECGFHPGAEFGVCLPGGLSVGQCWDQTDCGPNEVCEGPSFCACGLDCGMLQAPGQCKPKPTNLPCLEDSQCQTNEMCVGAGSCLDGMGGFDCVASKGKCLPKPIDGLCWTDADCGWSGKVCVGPVYCGGGLVCLTLEHPGVCLTPAQVGCWADADCPQPGGLGKAVCAGEWVIPWWTGNDYDADPDFPGECCLVPPGGCYQDADCPAQQECVGALFVAPGDCALGTAKAGECKDNATWPDEFCLSDADCTMNQTCVGEWNCPANTRCLESPYPGICLAQPAQVGSCFEDDWCQSGTTCTNPMVCDVLSGQMCGALMAAPGTCQALPPSGQGEPCGQYGGQCLSGLACCYPCGVPGCINVCQVPCDPQEPWCANGCAMMP